VPDLAEECRLSAPLTTLFVATEFTRILLRYVGHVSYLIVLVANVAAAVREHQRSSNQRVDPSSLDERRVASNLLRHR
jgi:hypothetical protein